MRFAGPIAGRLLDVGASYDAWLDLDFYQGDERLAGVLVPSVPWTGACYDHPGIQSRLLPLPAVLRERTWDRVVVRLRQGSDKTRLAHLLVFAEGVPGLEETKPAPSPARVRLEGESMLPLVAGTSLADEADATASGGLVRRGRPASPARSPSRLT